VDIIIQLHSAELYTATQRYTALYATPLYPCPAGLCPSYLLIPGVRCVIVSSSDE
jgi:hypothetical protein